MNKIIILFKTENKQVIKQIELNEINLENIEIKNIDVNKQKDYIIFEVKTWTPKH